MKYGLSRLQLICDFDGTLVDSRAAVAEVNERISERYLGRRLTRQEQAELMQLGIWQRIRTLGIPFWRVPSLWLDVSEVYRRNATQFPPYEGVPQLIRELCEEGCHLSIVTSNARRNVEMALAAHELCCFGGIISASLLPKRRFIARAAREARKRGRLPIYMGDEVRDVTASRAAGVPMIAVTWGYERADVLEESGVDFVASSVQEVREALQLAGRRAGVIQADRRGRGARWGGIFECVSGHAKGAEAGRDREPSERLRGKARG